MDVEAAEAMCPRVLHRNPNSSKTCLVIMLILFVAVVIIDILILKSYKPTVIDETFNISGYKTNDTEPPLLSVRLASLITSHVLSTHEEECPHSQKDLEK
jgi:hypothetical protein